MGFVATPELGNEAVALGVQALARLSHRGGLDADGKSGDGAGLLIQVPHRLLGDFAVAALFEWDERAQDIVAASLAEGGMEMTPRPTLPPDEGGPRLYMAPRRAEKRAEAEGVRMYLPSLSSRTLVY